jgi:hypothetical protein
MESIIKFSITITNAFASIILPILDTHADEMTNALANRMLDLEGPTIINRQLTRQETFVAKINHQSFVIQSTFESLLDADLYLRRFPYQDTRITKVRHLRYVIENYLNNVYILKQRLKTFVQTIEDSYAKGTQRKVVRRITQSLFKYNSTAFENLVTVRSSHVHKEPYSDKELGRLESIKTLISRVKMEDLLTQRWSEYFDLQYKEIRKEKVQELRSINQTMEQILDTNFDQIYPIVFDETGAIIYPA